MDKERLEKQVEFCLEIDKVKRIKRGTLCSDGQTFENDAEHSWHAALMALVLAEYSNTEIDKLKTVSMLLVHDLVEIYAGDAYAYDSSANLGREEREKAAADKLFSILPDGQGEQLRALWEEFEANLTPEAHFARAMDNFQPIMLNNATDGKMWAERKVKLSQVLKRNEITPLGSNELWDYALASFITPNAEKGRLENDTGKR